VGRRSKAFRKRLATVSAVAGLVVAFLACSSEDSKDDDDGSDTNSGGAGGADAAAPDAGGTPAGGSGGRAPQGLTIQPEWLACSTAADCVVMQPRTCVACVTLAVNAAYEQAVRDAAGDLADCEELRAAPCVPLPEQAECVDGECDFIVDCNVMEMARLCGEAGKCSVLSGPPCEGGDPVRVGCFPKAEQVRIERTCAEDPETGQQLVFLSTEIPPGWLECDVSQCVQSTP
jgi:hypothetical protein